MQEEATCVDGKKRGRESGVIGVKGGREDVRMKDCAARVQSEIVRCPPCEEA